MLSILAFALTAGYSSSDNTAECITLDGNANVTVTVRLSFGYTFHSEDFDVQYASAANTTNGSLAESTCQTDFDNNYDGGAEFFVAIGILSMLCTLGSLPIYMVFLNDQWSYSKIIANIVSRHAIIDASLKFSCRTLLPPLFLSSCI